MFYVLTVLFTCLYLVTDTKVQVDLGRVTKSLLNKSTNGANGTLIQNFNLDVELKCYASYPTQWIFNIDYDNANYEGLGRIEWTERKLVETTQHVAWLQLKTHKILTALTLTCVAVRDAEDALLVQFLPTQDFLQVVTWDKPAIHALPSQTSKLFCEFEFSFMFINSSGYYAKCTKKQTQELGTVVNYPCAYSASHCANTYRNLKAIQNTCVVVVDGQNELLQNIGWVQIGTDTVLLPGIVVCSIGENRGAQEFFFTSPDKVLEKREIHFSWNQIQPNSMISLTISPLNFTNTYYTGQNVNGMCAIPYYGFALYGTLVVKVNNTVQINEQVNMVDYTEKAWKKVISLNLDWIGRYEVICSGPIWNSTEFATKSVTFSVRDSIPPYFAKSMEAVIFLEGAVQESISCKAEGEPTPEVEWALEPDQLRNIRIYRDTLIFHNVTTLFEEHYTCMATNVLGQYALKTITVNVYSHQSESQDHLVAPYFVTPTENFTFEEGDEKKEIFCEASGQPNPQVDWAVEQCFPNIKVKGHALVFTKITDFVQGEYTCKARNVYGQFALKKAIVRVSRKYFPDALSPEGTNTLVIILGATIGLSILLLFSVAYFYRKFKTLNKRITKISADEYLEFREGKKTSLVDQDSPTDFVASLAYDKSVELHTSRFWVDTKQILGSGEFGIVYKGTVRNGTENVDAAFKTVKKDADIKYFKAMLLELKILTHVKNHEYIINLIGAWTQNIRNCEVYVIVELCDSCLLTFLRKNASSYLNFVTNGVISREHTSSSQLYGDSESTKQFSTFNLIQWGKEIATALDFIENQRIVHGDIAARNILLTSQLKTKLSDFGLARQLADVNYITAEKGPLPWRWMAIESLRDRQFSSKTDIWAFGVTIWEMFTLGSIPFPVFRWSIDFVTKLEEGMRLHQPTNVPTKIWELMVECWLLLPEHRPATSTLIQCFENCQPYS